MMTYQSLANRIVEALIEKDLVELTTERIYDWAEALAKAIIDEIHQNAEVYVTTAAGSGTGRVE